ncbi:MAG: 4-hydroxythreonine-4-phosphate dehydrogenase PdxA [bacterium]
MRSKRGSGLIRKPLIALTMGDAGGIGPEIVVKAIAEQSLCSKCRLIVIGYPGVFEEAIHSSNLALKVKSDRIVTDFGDEVSLMTVGSMRKRITIGKPTKTSGLAAFKALKTAVDIAMSGGIDGIVTAPVSKRSFALAGLGMVGHTEILAKLTGSKDVAMMLTRDNMRVVFATGHVRLTMVSSLLTIKSLVSKIRIANSYIQEYMGIRNPRIGVACFNPHCGEGGLLGDEEKKIIEPAIRSARNESIDVQGPFPADWLLSEPIYKRFDVVIAIYHDQGMIALRREGFDKVINITLGLPILRTSPGHGTAFEIAGKGIASPRSMINAVAECARIVERLER